jgi:hypothetical protein
MAGIARFRRRAGCHNIHDVIARLDRATQYSSALEIESRRRGVLDAPLSRGMTKSLKMDCRVKPGSGETWSVKSGSAGR